MTDKEVKDELLKAADPYAQLQSSEAELGALVRDATKRAKAKSDGQSSGSLG